MNANPVAQREYLDAMLREGSSGLTLTDIVAMDRSGTLDALFPPITTGTCGWCRGFGLVRKIADSSIEAICEECISVALDWIRAIVNRDEQMCVAMESRMNSRQGSAAGTLTKKEYSFKELMQVADAELEVICPKTTGTCFACNAEGEGRRVAYWHPKEMLCNKCWEFRYARMHAAANSQEQQRQENDAIKLVN
jgi:hypothetical protein